MPVYHKFGQEEPLPEFVDLFSNIYGKAGKELTSFSGFLIMTEANPIKTVDFIRRH